MLKDVGLTLTLQSHIEFLFFSRGRALQSGIWEMWFDRSEGFASPSGTQQKSLSYAEPVS